MNSTTAATTAEGVVGESNGKTGLSRSDLATAEAVVHNLETAVRAIRLGGHAVEEFELDLQNANGITYRIAVRDGEVVFV